MKKLSKKAKLVRRNQLKDGRLLEAKVKEIYFGTSPIPTTTKRLTKAEKAAARLAARKLYTQADIDAARGDAHSSGFETGRRVEQKRRDDLNHRAAIDCEARLIIGVEMDDETIVSAIVKNSRGRGFFDTTIGNLKMLARAAIDYDRVQAVSDADELKK